MQYLDDVILMYTFIGVFGGGIYLFNLALKKIRENDQDD
jgi:hypothetical protein